MKQWRVFSALALAAAICLTLLAGCGSESGQAADDVIFIDQVALEEIALEDEAVPLSEMPAALDTLLLPTASGTLTKKNDKAVIDYSNTKDGYVMVLFTATTATRLKVKVVGPTNEYQYDLPAQKWTTFPMSDENGDYKVTIYEQNASTGKYATVLSASFSVTLTDAFAPFIRPNQYVDYSNATETIAMAKKIISDANATTALDKVGAVYNYVVNNLTYDKEKAKTVKSGYLPVLDTVLAAKKGICFDYAALMAGMLRSQGVPCKLVVGYAGTAYHAWISVWTEATGWIDGAIYFDGTTWNRMDPTFASSGKSSASIMQYIGDGSNYTAKYIY